jgi:protein SCO1/2
MKGRRKTLIAGALALPGLALPSQGSDCRKPADGPMAEYFPNVVVQTHHGRKALFYDDLLRGKIVTLNFISTRDRVAHQVTENLVKVQGLLGDRVGDDIFMYSITTDPEHDTAAVLARFADEHGTGPGWEFLTGGAAEMQSLLSRIFVGPHQPTGRGHAHGCSRGLVRYGNLVTGTFGSFPAASRPELIALRFTWVGFKEIQA